MPMGAARELAAYLRRWRYAATTESEFQAAIAAALSASGREFEREVLLAKGDRIDFLLPDGVGIEVKIHGTAAAAERQLRRYAKSDRVRELILMTSRSQVAVQPEAIDGKPVVCVIWYGGLV